MAQWKLYIYRNTKLRSELRILEMFQIVAPFSSVGPRFVSLFTATGIVFLEQLLLIRLH
jgi:hypothetical protein